MAEPLYLGLDLSTQQLKAVLVTPELKVERSVVFDFDKDAPDFATKKGVLTNDKEREVVAPVGMWLRALDCVLERLSGEGEGGEGGVDLGRVKGVCGAGQQHGSVYWSRDGVDKLGTMEKGKGMEEQLKEAFSWDKSPNWQDASTGVQCEAFERALGGEEELARVTGSRAHHVGLLTFSFSLNVKGCEGGNKG